MSCWASDALAPLALAAALAIPAALPADAQAAPSDSARRVRTIRVTDQGIHIGGAGDSLARGGEESGEIVEIGGGKVRILKGTSGDDGHRVRVVGPVVLVDGEGADMVRVFADAEVPADRRVEGDVVAVFGSVTVRGQVSGNAVAVFGSVRLDPGAVVDGDAVAIGGALDQAEGSSVSGQSVSLGFLPVAFGLPGLPMVLLSAGLGWLATTLVGWLFFLIMPDRMLRVAVTSSRRTLVSLLLGLASGPLMVIAVVLLLITVVGIPIALLLPILFLVMAWAGQIAATYVIGCRIARRRLGEGSAWLPLMAGTVFVAAFYVVGGLLAAPEGAMRTVALFCFLLAVLLSSGLAIIGTGAFLLSRIGDQPRDVAFLRDPLAPAASPGPAPPVGV
jgi:hypothetical protein